jgi:hypothetical protein
MSIRRPAVSGGKRCRHPLDAGSSGGKDHCDALGNRSDELSPGRRHLRKLVGERRKDAADALPCLEEVARAEDPVLEQAQDMGIHLRSDRLHEVESQGGAAADVGMDDADARVEAERETGNPRLRLEERVR